MYLCNGIIHLCLCELDLYIAHAQMGENRRKLFEKECAILRKKEERGEVFHLADETRLKVKSLDASILVSVQCAASISNRIIRVRDEELEPQLFELLRG